MVDSAERAIDGTTRAFSPVAFVAEVFPIARRWIGRMDLQPADAEDLLQDVCATVLSAAYRRGADVFDGRSRLSTWVYRAVQNAMRMRARARARRGHAVLFADAPEIEDPAPWPDEVLARSRSIARVERAARALSEGERAILAASMADQSVAEIAEDTGACVGTTKTRMRRVRLKLSREVMREEAIA